MVLRLSINFTRCPFSQYRRFHLFLFNYTENFMTSFRTSTYLFKPWDTNLESSKTFWSVFEYEVVGIKSLKLTIIIACLKRVKWCVFEIYECNVHCIWNSSRIINTKSENGGVTPMKKVIWYNHGVFHVLMICISIGVPFKKQKTGSNVISKRKRVTTSCAVPWGHESYFRNWFYEVLDTNNDIYVLESIPRIQSMFSGKPQIRLP